MNKNGILIYEVSKKILSVHTSSTVIFTIKNYMNVELNIIQSLASFLLKNPLRRIDKIKRHNQTFGENYIIIQQFLNRFYTIYIK